METGLRPSELAALLVEHVDLRRQTLSVERTFSDFTLRTTTKQKRKGLIPLSDRAAQIAETHCQGKHPKTWLFVNPKGRTGNYNQRSISKLWRKYSGVAITCYEATRHSFASQLIENNDVAIIKELMRHSRH